jgi:hypothetical protein
MKESKSNLSSAEDDAGSDQQSVGSLKKEKTSSLISKEAYIELAQVPLAATDSTTENVHTGNPTKQKAKDGYRKGKWTVSVTFAIFFFQ